MKVFYVFPDAGMVIDFCWTARRSCVVKVALLGCGSECFMSCQGFLQASWTWKPGWAGLELPTAADWASQASLCLACRLLMMIREIWIWRLLPRKHLENGESSVHDYYFLLLLVEKSV